MPIPLRTTTWLPVEATRSAIPSRSRSSKAMEAATTGRTILDWNEPSIAFYRALGADAMSEWTTYRLTGDALRALAAECG